jgi:hypothetical protein
MGWVSTYLCRVANKVRPVWFVIDRQLFKLAATTAAAAAAALGLGFNLPVEVLTRYGVTLRVVA